jgi:hypothetical protein
MSTTLERVWQLVATGQVKVSDHGYDELSNDGLTVREVVDGIKAGQVVEDYPAYARARAFWCFSVTNAARHSMRCGAFRAGRTGRLF